MPAKTTPTWEKARQQTNEGTYVFDYDKVRMDSILVAEDAAGTSIFSRRARSPRVRNPSACIPLFDEGNDSQQP